MFFKFFFLLFFSALSFSFTEKEMDVKGIEKLLKKDYKGALKIYEDAYKKYPNYAPILQNLANIYLILKKEESAIEILKKLCFNDPQRDYPFKLLRLLLYSKGKEYEFLEIASNRYIKTKSEDALRSLIDARLRIGHISQVKKLLKKIKFEMPSFEEFKNKDIKNLIFLITLDTFRYDHLNEKLTPNLYKIKNESYFFKNFFAVSPITLPAHCSIFTGLYPVHNGVRDNSIYKLKEDALTLPEILNKYGYSSYGFISSFLLHKRFGLSQGFKFYQDNFIPLYKKSHFPSTRRAEDTLKNSLDYLKNLKEKSALFFIHLYDPHAPYEPPFPFDEAYPEAPYKGEVAYMDYCLGEFFNVLKKSNLYDKSLFIILSDHGEGLGDKGEPTHGFLLYNSTLHIPLIIHLPKQKEKKELDLLASQVDLLPTILNLMKIPALKCDGINLFDPPKERSVFSETELPISFNWSSLFKVYKGDFSYISNPSNKLFNLKKDEFEKFPIKNEKMQKILESEIESYKNEKKLWDVEEEILDEEMIKNLRSLGYHQSYLKPKNKEKLPNPEEKMESLILYQTAISYEEKNNLKELLKIAKELEKKEERNEQFLAFCAEWYFKAGYEKKAEEAIIKALKINEDFAQGWFYFGFLKENFDKEKAIEYYKKAIGLEPKHFLSRYNLSRLYLLKNEYKNAEEEMLSVLKIFPEHSYTLNNLGYLYYKRDKNCKKGKFLIEKAYNLKKEDENLKLSYASILCNCGEKDKGKIILKDISKNLPNYEEVLKSCN